MTNDKQNDKTLSKKRAGFLRNYSRRGNFCLMTASTPIKTYSQFMPTVFVISFHPRTIKVFLVIRLLDFWLLVRGRKMTKWMRLVLRHKFVSREMIFRTSMFGFLKNRKKKRKKIVFFLAIFVVFPTLEKTEKTSFF